MARTLVVKVKPGAKLEKLVQESDGTWTAHVKAPPVEGRANEALVALLARHFGVRRAQVAIRSGATGRLKRVVVEDE